MTRKGVLVSLNSDDAELMRHLNTEAGKAMKYGGMNETEALAMVTINPAKQLGIDKTVGSIEVGKDADLVLYDGFPMSDFAKVQKVWIDGAQYFDRDKEIAAQATKEAEKKKLLDKEKAAQQKQQPTRRPNQ
jgi:imidazolonepropionase-like amidohydrolase